MEYLIKNQVLIHADCLDAMQEIPDASVDMILADLPYGTTACKWDAIIPFEPLWKQYKRIAKSNAAVVLTASQPFTSALVMSNINAFKYCWVWDKKKPANYANAKQQPMKYHEDISVFCFGKCPYFPIMVPMPGRKAKKGKNDGAAVFNRGLEREDYLDKVYEDKYPSSILEFSNADQTKRLHPTQKPVALFEHLIKTYSNPGEVVLDNTMGSGTTLVACINTGRFGIGIEKDADIFDDAKKRIEAHEGPAAD